MALVLEAAIEVNMQEPLPSSIDEFKEKHPSVWDAFSKLGEACHHTGPLDEKTRRLVKLALSVALRHEGGVHSATRRALESGVTRDEMEHVALLAITTVGWPAANAAMTWIADESSRKTTPEEP
jgi:alkylhydroperoxidase/carboxymuconolactone decarboxylase family protein YurZ